MAQLDFWFDFASTYSYPAAMRIAPLAQAAGVRVRWRPFLLGAVFKQLGLPLDSPFNLQPAKGRYMWRDIERLCAALDLPFRRPDPFPQASMLAARVMLAGLEQGWGEDFARAVFRAEFGEGAPIGAAETLAGILQTLGVSSQEALERANAEPVKSRLRTETDEAIRLGIFGAPAFVTAGGELFWGNDRLEAALEWARKTS